MDKNRNKQHTPLHEPDSRSMPAWEKVFEALPEFAAIVDPEWRVLQVNQSLALRLGTTPGNCRGRLWHELLGLPDDLVQEQSNSPEFGPSETEGHLEIKALGGWFLVRRAPILRSDGSLEAICLTIRDVTTQHSAERELHDTQEWLWMALKSVRMGTWDWDITTNKVRYVSPRSYLNGGLMEQQQTDRDEWSYTTHPEDVDKARTQIDQVISGQAQEFSVVVRMRRGSNDTWTWIHSRGRATERDSLGKALRMVGVYEDVSNAVEKAEQEQKQAEMIERTSRLNSLGALASSLAHEINQPLAALTSYLEASIRLFEKGDSHREETRHALERSVALAGKASEVVRRVRRLLRRERPLAERIDLPDFLYTVQDQMLREARAIDVGIEVVEGPSPVSFYGDRVQIEQVLTNLVRNGLEALSETSREPRRISLGFRVSGESVQIEVSDTGPGIPEEEVDRLFSPFFTTKQGGSGLGLVVCESIVELHGGRIRLDSTGPKGSTFMVELPIRPQGVESGG